MTAYSPENNPENSPEPGVTPCYDFRAEPESLLKTVVQQGREIILIRDGYPLARVVPYRQQPGDPAFPVTTPLNLLQSWWPTLLLPIQDWEGMSEPAPPEQLFGQENPGGAAANSPDGKPVKVSPFGLDRAILRILGDIESPIDVEWEAGSDPDRALPP